MRKVCNKEDDQDKLINFADGATQHMTIIVYALTAS
jgi:hypothetical protein